MTAPADDDGIISIWAADNDIERVKKSGFDRRQSKPVGVGAAEKVPPQIPVINSALNTHNVATATETVINAWYNMFILRWRSNK